MKKVFSYLLFGGVLFFPLQQSFSKTITKVAQSGTQVTIVNKTPKHSACTYENATVTLFFADNSNTNVNNGESRTFLVTTPGYSLGIQDNGWFWRIPKQAYRPMGTNPPFGTQNPDNAGMNLILDNLNTCEFHTTASTVSGEGAPDARKIIKVDMVKLSNGCQFTLSPQQLSQYDATNSVTEGCCSSGPTCVSACAAPADGQACTKSDIDSNQSPWEIHQ